jgi:hypothetical protein
VELRFLGKESTPDDSPTLYATDCDSFIIQGVRREVRDFRAEVEDL